MFAHLTGEDIALLSQRVARALRVSAIEAEEWLHEALYRALDGRRRWPADVEMATFIVGVASSVRSAAVKSQARQRERECWWAQATEMPQKVETLATLEALARGAPTDAHRAVMYGRAMGMSRREIIDRLAVTETQYETAMKWIRRTQARWSSDGRRSV